VTVTVYPVMLGGATASGSITITDSNATNSPVNVPVTMGASTVVSGLLGSHNDAIAASPNVLDRSAGTGMKFYVVGNENAEVHVHIYDSSGRWVGKVTGTCGNTGTPQLAEINFYGIAGMDQTSAATYLGPGIYWARAEGSGVRTTNNKKPFMIVLKRGRNQ